MEDRKGKKVRRLILFIDSGDTLVDEGSECRAAGSEVVERAQLTEGAKEAILLLKKEGFTIALVADGIRESFENVYRQHGLRDAFDVWAVPEEVGEEKPSPRMFRAAMDALGLQDADKGRILMAGNNLKRDILGANRFGITSVLMSWSPRYCMTPEGPEEEPDYTVRTPGELAALLLRLDAEVETRA